MILINSKDIHIKKPLVATIGFFDGVHRGHRFLIDQLKEEAKKRSLPSAVITFAVHPREVLDPNFEAQLLCGNQEKIDLLASTGLDYCILLDFTQVMSAMSANTFMRDVLCQQLNVDTLLIGYDHRFGHNRREGFDDYKDFGNEMGMHVLQALELNSEENISSSRIKELLSEGKVVEAAYLLSYNYVITGKVVEGFKIGRTLGFPTANLQVCESSKTIPACGVYAVLVHVDSSKYKAMLYIGTRPTLDQSDVSVEANLFDFEGDLYGKDISVEFIDFVRGDQKFPDLTSLKAQIARDKETTQHLLENY